MPLGPCSPPLLTTCSAGWPPSGSSTPAPWWPRPSGGSTSHFREDSPTGRDGHSSTCRRAGHGRGSGPNASTACGPCRFVPDRPQTGCPPTVPPLPARSPSLTLWVSHALFVGEVTQRHRWHQLPGRNRELVASPLRFGGSRLSG